MSQPKFVHLRIHSEYSVIDGLVRLEPLMEHMVNANMPALALTDQMNLFAAVKFYKAARAKGLKAIFGCDIWLENPKDAKAPFLCTLLCQNQQGYQHLTQLISRAYQAEQPHGIPQVKREWLPIYQEGLILLSGGMQGDIGQALLQEDLASAKAQLKFWKETFPDRFYIELQRIGRENEEHYIQRAIALAQQEYLPVVATNDIRFLEQTDYLAHDVRVCIHRGEQLADPRRKKDYTQQQYLRSTLEMQQLFSDIPQALENTVEIAKRCNVELSLGHYVLPDFPIPEHMTPQQYFTERAQQGLEKRLERLLDPNAENYPQEKQIYETRLQTELDVLIKMGFAGYFLIVADFIQWSKNHGIPVGPGRGSGAGSLVAYALGITGLDPLAYDLLFERFLNPERVSMPDFDIDFCMEGRDRVIDYVAQRYGRDSVSQIITFGTMAAKAAIRDVGRVLGYPYGFIDGIAKLIPFELGITLDKSLAQEELLQERYQQEDEVREVFDMARCLEGLTRNVGKHAGGVVIAPSAITNFAPVYCEPGSEHILTQFDKDDGEAIGLVKFDFLGLRTLTIIDWALKTIEQTQQKTLDIEAIPVDDPAVFKLLQACETTAVFQLESRGMKDLIKRLQPDCFEDIIALVALFRPGPLQSGMVDDFINRKHGLAKVEYPHPDLEPILNPTYGIILYQEQVMQIAQVLAGYTLGAADLLRRAMGKKKPEEMAKQRQIFTQGALQRGVEESVATYIFDLMEKFAGYGFNKSHSAAYALVAYQTAWLKAHYPAEFMAAVLSSDMDNTDKVVIFNEEAQRMGLTVRPPNINEGQYPFTVNAAGQLVYGLGAIKGAGHAAIDSMLTERARAGTFSDLFEFCCRVDLKKINRKVLEVFIKSGAMDDFKQERSTLFESLNTALKLAEQQARDQHTGQQDLFAASMVSPAQESHYTEVPPWREAERLLYEKESLGFYLSGHPLDGYRQELKQFCKTTLKDLKPTYEQLTRVAGQIVSIRTLLTKHGDRMAILGLEDGTARVEAAVFSDVYQQTRELLVKDALVVIEGEVGVDDYTGGYRMSCRTIISLGQARAQYGKYVLLTLQEGTDVQPILAHLPKLLQAQSPGVSSPLHIEYHTPTAKARLRLGPEYRVNPTDEHLQQLRQALAVDVRVIYTL